jgi:hypothetical protein
MCAVEAAASFVFTAIPSSPSVMLLSVTVTSVMLSISIPSALAWFGEVLMVMPHTVAPLPPWIYKLGCAAFCSVML